MAMTTVCNVRRASTQSTWIERLNGPWHKRALQAFMVIVLAHWAEHLAQAVQVYMLHWPRPLAGGVLGLWMPLYLLLVQKRVYRQGWIMTLLKYSVLGTCYFVLIVFAASINLAVSVVAM